MTWARFVSVPRIKQSSSDTALSPSSVFLQEYCGAKWEQGFESRSRKFPMTHAPAQIHCKYQIPHQKLKMSKHRAKQMYCLRVYGCIRLENCAAYENKHTRAVSMVKLKKMVLGLKWILMKDIFCYLLSTSLNLCSPRTWPWTSITSSEIYISPLI